MISFASSSRSSTTSFFGQKLAVESRPSIPIRPSRISVKCSSATMERPALKSDSLYEVLGIRMEATCQEIKSAYRRLARVVHPDVASPENSSAAAEFMKIHEAYSTLSDPDKRADYDRALFGRQWSSSTTRRSGSHYSYSRPRTWETDQCW